MTSPTRPHPIVRKSSKIAKPKTTSLLTAGIARNISLPMQRRVVDNISKNRIFIGDSSSVNSLLAVTTPTTSAKAEYSQDLRIVSGANSGNVGANKTDKKKGRERKKLKDFASRSNIPKDQKVGPTQNSPSGTPTKVLPEIKRLMHEAETYKPYQINSVGRKSQPPAYIIPANSPRSHLVHNPRNIKPEQEMSYQVSEHTLLIGKKQSVTGAQITRQQVPQKLVTYNNPNCTSHDPQTISVPFTSSPEERGVLAVTWEKWWNLLAASEIRERVLSLVCTRIQFREGRDAGLLGEEWVIVSKNPPESRVPHTSETSEGQGPSLVQSASSEFEEIVIDDTGGPSEFAARGSICRKITGKVKAATNQTYVNLKYLGRESSLAAAVKVEKVRSRTRRLSQSFFGQLHDFKASFSHEPGVEVEDEVIAAEPEIKKEVEVVSIPIRRKTIKRSNSLPRYYATSGEAPVCIDGSPPVEGGYLGSPVDIQSLMEKMHGLETVYIDDEADFFINNYGAKESPIVSRKLARSGTSVSRFLEQMRKSRRLTFERLTNEVDPDQGADDAFELDPTIDQGNTADFLDSPSSSRSYLKPLSLVQNSNSRLIRSADSLEEPEFQNSLVEKEPVVEEVFLKEFKLVKKRSQRHNQVRSMPILPDLQVPLESADDLVSEENSSYNRVGRFQRASGWVSRRDDSSSELFL